MTKDKSQELLYKVGKFFSKSKEVYNNFGTTYSYYYPTENKLEIVFGTGETIFITLPEDEEEYNPWDYCDATEDDIH